MARQQRARKVQQIPCKRCGVLFGAQRIDAMWCGGCRALRRKEISSSHEQRSKCPCSICGEPTARRSTLCLSCENKRRADAYRGENNPNWREGRTLDRAGYVHVRVKPNGPKPYRLEHHLVWERANGRPLPKGYIIHHLNGIKGDNRIENLAAVSRLDHHVRHAEPYEARIRQLEAELAELRGTG